MSNFQANLRALVENNSNLEQIMPKLNERVMSSAKGEKFITMFLAKYNYTTRTLEYITAAHNPPIMYKTESKELKFLKEGCLGLGMLDEIPTIQKGREQIDERTKLLCYTDGLVEIMDETKVHYDTDQIKNRMANDEPIDKNMSTIIREQSILDDENNAIFDDISMIGIEFFP
jgi:sigma-B regulation protein RsbU (phosphoserine phosphatase)